jgi:hypothetical protein
MMPQGGFTVLIHTALIIIVWIFRKLRYVTHAGIRLPRATLVAVPLLAIAICTTAGMLIATALAEQPTYTLFMGTPQACAPHTFTLPEGPVAILRIDDIQAHAWRDIQLRMIDDALARDMRPVLGVIPVGFMRDGYLFSFLRARRCDVEIALHGWDNQDTADGRGEFAYLSERESLARLEQGKSALAKIEPNIRTFIPPENEMSLGALASLGQAGFSVLSSGGGRPDDFHATTYDFATDQLHTPASILTKCNERFVRGQHCVIMVHPQDFSMNDHELDPEKYAHYTALLDALVVGGVRVVRFSDLYAPR